MKKTAQGWQVIDEERGVLVYEYTFTKGASANAMTVRLSDGTLAIISPPCAVSDAVFKDLEGFGAVGALVANNSFHHMGLPLWHKVAPSATLHAAPAAMARIRKQQPGLPALAPVSDLEKRLSAECAVIEAPGTRCGDVWLKAGATWFVGDCFFNLAQLPPGMMGMLMNWTHSGPGLSISGLYKTVFLKNRRAYKQWLITELETESPTTLVTSHGKVEATPALSRQMRSLAEARL